MRDIGICRDEDPDFIDHLCECMEIVLARVDTGMRLKLVDRYCPTIHRIAGEVMADKHISPAHYVAIFDGGMEGLLSGIDTYDCGSGFFPSSHVLKSIHFGAMAKASSLNSSSQNDDRAAALVGGEVEAGDNPRPDTCVEVRTLTKMTHELDKDLRELSKEHRSVILMYHFGGWSASQIASELLIPEEHIPLLLERATSALAAVLGSKSRSSAQLP